MSRRLSRDPWAPYRTPPNRNVVPYLNRLRDAGRAAPPARRAELLDDIMTVMLTADLLSYPEIRVGLRAATNRDLLLKKAVRDFGFDEHRGKPLEEFAQSRMRGVALDDGSSAVEFYAELE
jgi:hypothetical protein